MFKHQREDKMTENTPMKWVYVLEWFIEVEGCFDQPSKRLEKSMIFDTPDAARCYSAAFSVTMESQIIAMPLRDMAFVSSLGTFGMPHSSTNCNVS